MKQVKWIMPLLLVLVLFFTTARVEAAEIFREGTCGENLTWVLTEDGTLTISGTGEMENYSYSNYSPWRNSEVVQNVIIQEGVTSIGDEAFMGCQNLASIDFPTGLVSIGNYAFKDCNSYLTSVELPVGVLSIGDSAFSGCDNLTSIVLPAGLTSIGDAAFYDCGKMTSINLPAGLTSIGNYTFLNCSSLQRITVDENNMHYSNDESGVLFNKDKTELVAAPGTLQVYSIPAGVTDILPTAFSGCRSLTSIELPVGLVSIGNYAFQHCSSLASINFPAGLTSIGEAAFESCVSLTSIDFPDGLIYIDDYAFMLCYNLTDITFSGDAPSIGVDVFDSVTATAYYPYGNKTWTNDMMQDYDGDITWIPYGEGAEIASGWSGATQWTLTNNGVITFYGEGNMKNYDYSGGQPWEDYANQITAVVIKEGITSVGECAFKGLTNLESITLPENGLKRIGDAAFYGCTSLKSLYIPDGIYTIWEYTFKNCTGLEYIRLPETLEKIDQGAFENCNSLSELFLPTNVNIIGAWSFKGCTALKSVDMQWANATEIREGAFKNCAALTEIILPDNIQTLGDSCFYGIGSTRFVVPATVTEIADWCFARSSVKEIVFEGDAPAIGTGAFNKITLAAYYDSNNTTWTSDIMRNYGGSVIWKEN